MKGAKQNRQIQNIIKENSSEKEPMPHSHFGNINFTHVEINN